MEHLDEVHAIEERSFITPWSKTSIYEDFINPHAYYFIAVDEQARRIVGYASMWHVVNEGQINNIAVDEAFRRCGAGAALMDAMVALAKEKEMIGLTLEVRMGNRAAMALYHKYGFKAEGIRKNYYTDTNEDAVIMWRAF
jgi:ribosomal-protein-alanine N-acetyltransferase